MSSNSHASGAPNPDAAGASDKASPAEVPADAADPATPKSADVAATKAAAAATAETADMSSTESPAVTTAKATTGVGGYRDQWNCQQQQRGRADTRAQRRPSAAGPANVPMQSFRG
jgi:hypothetical protein